MAEASTRGLTITVSQKLVTETCCNCGMLFAMTADFQAELYKGKTERERSFYCPAGHSQHYLGKSEAQVLKEQLETERRARQRAEQRVAEVRDEVEHERHRADGYKGYAVRLRKRTAAGVCPCCNRSFENLRRHMSTKHPTFEPALVEA